jgi:hypothetical protein
MRGHSHKIVLNICAIKLARCIHVFDANGGNLSHVRRQGVQVHSDGGARQSFRTNPSADDWDGSRHLDYK